MQRKTYNKPHHSHSLSSYDRTISLSTQYNGLIAEIVALFNQSGTVSPQWSFSDVLSGQIARWLTAHSPNGIAIFEDVCEHIRTTEWLQRWNLGWFFVPGRIEDVLSGRFDPFPTVKKDHKVKPDPRAIEIASAWNDFASLPGCDVSPYLIPSTVASDHLFCVIAQWIESEPSWREIWTRFITIATKNTFLKGVHPTYKFKASLPWCFKRKDGDVNFMHAINGKYAWADIPRPVGVYHDDSPATGEITVTHRRW